MKRRRITIAHIVLVVLIAAIGLAAIRSGSTAWAGAMVSITFFVMICSLLGVVLERGMRRVYWLGFASLGWSYLLLTFAPWLDVKVGQFLLAPNLFAQLNEVLHPDAQGVSGFQSVPVWILGSTVTSGAMGGGSGAADLADFVWIGVSMEALLWAFIGGWVACYFASGRDPIAGPAVAPQAGGTGDETTQARDPG